MASETSQETSRKARPFMAAVVFLGFLAGVQGSCPNIASTALVGASKSLDMAGSMQALAASVQTLAIAATVISTGLMADRLGRRRVLMVALIVGGVGNLIALASPSSGVYMLGLALAGVGLGTTYGAAFAYMRVVVPPTKLAGALGIFSAVLMVATVLLTFLGGMLSAIDWRWAFILIPICCLVGLILTPILLPEQDRIGGGSLDIVGQVLLALGVILFLYSVSQFVRSLTAPQTLVPLAGGTVLLAAFFIWEAKNPKRFFPVSLFRSPIFLAALCAGFIYNFGTAVSFLQVTNLWQYVNGLDSGVVALWQLPLMLSGVIGALVIGRLMARGLSNRSAIVLGGACTTAGFLLIAGFHEASSLFGYLPGLCLAGAGVIICAVPFGDLILRVAPREYFGPVTSARTTVGQFFYTLGFALSTVLVDRMTLGGVTSRLQAEGVPQAQIHEGLSAVTSYAYQDATPSTQVGKDALADAFPSYGSAFAITLCIAAALFVLATVYAFWLLRNGEDAPTATSAAEPDAASGPVTAS